MLARPAKEHIVLNDIDSNEYFFILVGINLCYFIFVIQSFIPGDIPMLASIFSLDDGSGM